MLALKSVSVIILVWSAVLTNAAHGQASPRSGAAQQYLTLIENFGGFAERHWNDKEESYDAAGSGVTWARGNGGVCLVMAVLLEEFPERDNFFPQKVPRRVILDHVRRTLRRLCLTSNCCTDPRAIKPGTWDGVDPKGEGWHWQAGLETEHWVLAAHLLAKQLDDDTKSLVRQIAVAEADGAMQRPIHSGKKGNTTADDCSWNAGILGVVAAIYSDDPRAVQWDEAAKRWALNMEGRECDRHSERIIDGKPLKDWLVSTNVFDDFTLENHGFWDLPYQTGFAAMAEPIVAYQLCGKPIPEAFRAHAIEEGEHIFKWLVMPDGDLLCPQGIDWAERDVQHSWAFAVLGTLYDQPWALAAEARCLKLLTLRQAHFGDGSIHALDFGYETDLAAVWTFSFLMHKHFGTTVNRSDVGSLTTFDEPRGAHLYPHVATAVYRTPDLVSSVTWFRNRQGIMVSPNNLSALQGREAFTRYDRQSGTGWVRLGREKKPRAMQVPREAKHREAAGSLLVSFVRELPREVRQEIDYAALPTGEVVVFSRWMALRDITVAELVDHPFRWVEIENFIPSPEVRRETPGVWIIGNALQLQVFNGSGGELVRDGINGVILRDLNVKNGATLLDTVCVYQPRTSARSPLTASIQDHVLQLGPWQIRKGDTNGLQLTIAP